MPAKKGRSPSPAISTSSPAGVPSASTSPVVPREKSSLHPNQSPSQRSTKLLPPIGAESPSSSPSRSRPQEAPSLAMLTDWSLPAATKNFRKSVQSLIQSKLDFVRTNDEAMQVFDRHCRRIIHERVLGQHRGELEVTADCHSAPDGHHETLPVQRSSVSPSPKRATHLSPLDQRVDTVRTRRSALEMEFFLDVTRKHEESVRHANTLRIPVRQWKSILLAHIWLRSTVARLNDHVAEVTRATSGVTPRVVKRLTPRSLSAASSAAAPVVERFLGWRLVRASVVLKWAAKVSRLRVATDRIANVLRGSTRMSAIHQAMHLFRRRLRACQRAVRRHRCLREGRRELLALAWTTATSKYVDMILQRYDPAKTRRGKTQGAGASPSSLTASHDIDFGSVTHLTSFRRRPSLNTAAESPEGDGLTALTRANSYFFASPSLMQAIHPSSPEQPSKTGGGESLVGTSSAGTLERSPSWFRRDESVALDETRWRPLVHQRSASPTDPSRAMENSKFPSTLGTSAQLRQARGASSPTQSAADFAGVSASGDLLSPDSPSLTVPSSPSQPQAANRDRDTTLSELLATCRQLDLPERRVAAVLGRLRRYLNEWNEHLARQHRAEMSVFRFDMEHAQAKSHKGQIVDLPVPPRPRLVVAVPSQNVLMCLAKAEVDEHIMRSFTSHARRVASIQLPPAQPEWINAMEELCSRERIVAKWKKHKEKERRMKELLERDVEPMVFPAVSHRDTVRVFTLGAGHGQMEPDRDGCV